MFDNLEMNPYDQLLRRHPLHIRQSQLGTNKNGLAVSDRLEMSVSVASTTVGCILIPVGLYPRLRRLFAAREFGGELCTLQTDTYPLRGDSMEDEADGKSIRSSTRNACVV